MESPNSSAKFNPTAADASSAPNSGHTRLVARYNLLKRTIRWLLVLFILSGITLTIFTAIADRTPRSVLQEGQLGSNMAVLGKTIVLPIIRDNLQEILISTDNGNHFVPTGDRWPVTDTTLYLGISPDSSTIVAIDKKGIMRIKAAGEAHFVEKKLNITGDDNVSGFAFHSDGKQLYVYGSMPMQLLNFRDNVVTRTYDDSLHILSLTTGPNGNMLAYLWQNTGGQESLYYETGTESFRPFYKGVSNFPGIAVDRPQPVVNTHDDLLAADSAHPYHDSVATKK